MNKKSIFVINGSASATSANKAVINYIISNFSNAVNFKVCKDLNTLPPFDADITQENLPIVIQEIIAQIKSSDAIIICTPEYIFSVPSGLKNLFEWGVGASTFEAKKVGLIVAATQGIKAQETLKTIMQTLLADLNKDTNLLIPAIKSKLDKDGNLYDPIVKEQLGIFMHALLK
jgi:chromate reductase, NAD(P)H dehydrogenase (quinone)